MNKTLSAKLIGRIRNLKMKVESYLHLKGIPIDDCRDEIESQLKLSVSSKVFQFPLPKNIHYATVKDRPRNSGLTSVGFINSTHVICCDFNEKTSYYSEIIGEKLNILDSHPTITSDGMPVQTDLIDVRKNEFVVSNFYQGSVSHYEVIDHKIKFIREINHNSFKNLHGVRFIPNYDSLLWLAYCGGNNKCHQIYDMKKNKVIHEFSTDQQCQDISFVGKYAVVFARTDHIAKGNVKLTKNSPKNTMFATAYIYELPKNIYEAPPIIKRIWKGNGHIDSTKAGPNGCIYAANQYLDRVDVLKVDQSGIMSLIQTIDGYELPHGLDIKGKELAVTCYQDSTLRVAELTPSNLI
ncbi:hypothetical protein L0668_08705 [Paraglaciecola aquimarina]|uniref:Uncharacterized protein n=1 Tax=Paraglaciecola algarum TaxID=3050085 RepID=A0ABS9D5G9_9ALTE|nr:hypothetical protein [Paraglaciecola sp. G1-23]MCF2948183.1 hypothetical protein [Paraglaciecola sp. G1-23]